MLELTFVRHGSVEEIAQNICYGWNDVLLNDKGRAEAMRAAIALREAKFDAVYASPLARTRETAEIIMRENKHMEDVHFELLDDLREMHFGHWEGQNYDDICRDYAELFWQFEYDNLKFEAPGGESVATFTERVSTALDYIIGRHKEGKVLVVTHYGCITVAVYYLLKMPDPAWRFKIEPGNCCCFEVKDGFARMTKMNPWG